MTANIFSLVKIFLTETGNIFRAVPEDVAERAAHLLMEEVYRGGVLDTVTQALAVTLMSLTPPDVSKVTLEETFYSQYLHLSCQR